MSAALESEPRVSVVIPTHDRLSLLEEVIAALEGQRGAPPFEIVVVDDGSRDGTAEWLEAQRARPRLRSFRQENAGPAAARNRGVAEARGQWVAFLGDDTVPCPGWLAEHAAGWESEEPVGVIGYTRWHPRIRTTPFLRYINEYGLQFGYALIEDPENVPFNFFYTSNLSLPRRLLVDEPFDEAFPYAAWEDIELSYRLQKRGLRLRYRPGAVVDHDHPTDLARFCRRQRRAGYCAVVFYHRHPELGSFLGLAESGPPELPSSAAHGVRKAVARLLQHLPLTGPMPGLGPLWEEVLRYHYIEGLRQGWRELES